MMYGLDGGRHTSSAAFIIAMPVTHSQFSLTDAIAWLNNLPIHNKFIKIKLV